LESGGLSILPETWQVDEGGGDILKRERESDNRAGALCARESRDEVRACVCVRKTSQAVGARDGKQLEVNPSSVLSSVSTVLALHLQQHSHWRGCGRHENICRGEVAVVSGTTRTTGVC
jgi:hypothetical protein